jgi:hypothetical protein
VNYFCQTFSYAVVREREERRKALWSLHLEAQQGSFNLRNEIIAPVSEYPEDKESGSALKKVRRVGRPIPWEGMREVARCYKNWN